MTQSTGSNLEDIINKHEQEHKEQMKDIIKPVELKTFKAYPLIVAVMALLQMMATIFGRKFVIFMGFNVAISSIVFIPAILYVFQIVAECYGYQYARQIVWCNFVVNLISTILFLIIKEIPCNSFTHTDLAFSYNHLINTMWVSSAMSCVVIFLADYFSTSIMSYSKFMYNGRFMFLRMIIVHILSEVILSGGTFVSLPYNGYSIADTWNIVYNTFFARTIMSVIMLPFTIGIVVFIQHHIEKVVSFDNSRNFWNIFQWSIQDKSTVQFDYEQWNRLSAERKKRVDISKIALDYYTDEKLGIDKIFKNKK